MRFAAHFDGRVLVPDEPVNLPVDQPLSIQVDPANSPFLNAGVTLEEQHDALDRLLHRPLLDVPSIPVEALRRENLYADEADGSLG